MNDAITCGNLGLECDMYNVITGAKSVTGIRP